MNAETDAVVRSVLAANGSTADIARALGVTWGTAKHHRSRFEAAMLAKPITRLRVVVVFDDPVLAATLTESQRRKLAGGIVCTNYPFGVSVGWGGYDPRARAEQAQVHANVDDAIAWLTSRAAKSRNLADLCPGTATAAYSLDRAEFLAQCADVLRVYSTRLWS